MTESDLTDDDEYVAACMSGELSRQIARLEPPFHLSLCRTREAGVERRRACMLSFEFFIVESRGISLPSDIRHIQSSCAFKTDLNDHLYKHCRNKLYQLLLRYGIGKS